MNDELKAELLDILARSAGNCVITPCNLKSSSFAMEGLLRTIEEAINRWSYSSAQWREMGITPAMTPEQGLEIRRTLAKLHQQLSEIQETHIDSTSDAEVFEWDSTPAGYKRIR